MTYSQLSISLGRPSDTVLWVLWRCAGAGTRRDLGVGPQPLFGALCRSADEKSLLAQPGLMVSGDVAALQESELSAKRRVVRLQRQLLTARAAHAVHQIGVVKQANVLAARAEMDRLLSRDITAGMVGEPPASEEGLRSLASQLQLKMNQMYSVIHNGIPTKVSWYRLCAAATATATARCAAARSLAAIPPSPLLRPGSSTWTTTSRG